MATSARAQVRIYDIKAGKITIGQLVATQQIDKQNQVNYTLKSKVMVNFLVYKVAVDYYASSSFKDNILQNATAKVKSNKGEFYSETTLQNKAYIIKSMQKDKNVNKIYKNKITSSFGSLFFNEPTNQNQTYAEYYTDFINLKPTENHTFIGVLDKKIDQLIYKNGSLVKVIKKNPILDITISLKDI